MRFGLLTVEAEVATKTAIKTARKSSEQSFGRRGIRNESGSCSAMRRDVDDRRFGCDYERLLFEEVFVLGQKEKV